jgi:hypothetical protein
LIKTQDFQDFQAIAALGSQYSDSAKLKQLMHPPFLLAEAAHRTGLPHFERQQRNST